MALKTLDIHVEYSETGDEEGRFSFGQPISSDNAKKILKYLLQRLEELERGETKLLKARARAENPENLIDVSNLTTEQFIALLSTLDEQDVH